MRLHGGLDGIEGGFERVPRVASPASWNQDRGKRGPEECSSSEISPSSLRIFGIFYRSSVYGMVVEGYDFFGYPIPRDFADALSLTTLYYASGLWDDEYNGHRGEERVSGTESKTWRDEGITRGKSGDGRGRGRGKEESESSLGGEERKAIFPVYDYIHDHFHPDEHRKRESRLFAKHSAVEITIAGLLPSLTVKFNPKLCSSPVGRSSRSILRLGESAFLLDAEILRQKCRGRFEDKNKGVSSRPSFTFLLFFEWPNF
ncbi:hypothetical protein KM043_004139 [Ampulex compressa]|nr:hypothetical protein KM043_004139 [Ampulex compressa]